MLMELEFHQHKVQSAAMVHEPGRLAQLVGGSGTCQPPLELLWEQVSQQSRHFRRTGEGIGLTVANSRYRISADLS